MAKRIVLAYSGGLDTSVAVKWLQEEMGAEVIALAADVGQGGDFEAIRQRALGAGAVEAIVVDCRAEYADEYCAPALAANALYEGKYPLVSSLSRPVIAKHLVAAARAHGATAVAHGCTGKGNDQVRFEVSTRALAPDLEVIAPVRTWGMTREDCIEYAAKHDIPLTVSKEKLYSIDENLWGRAIECGVMEDPWVAPPDDVYALTVRDARRSRPRSSSPSSRASRCRSTVCALPLLELVDERRPRSSAPTASAASTWWRTAGSASRAARPTSARARSR